MSIVLIHPREFLITDLTDKKTIVTMIEHVFQDMKLFFTPGSITTYRRFAPTVLKMHMRLKFSGIPKKISDEMEYIGNIFISTTEYFSKGAEQMLRGRKPRSI